MKITKQTLNQIIKEEIQHVLSEADEDPFLYGTTSRNPPGLYDPEPGEIPWEYVLDDLVSVARDAIMPLAIKRLQAVGALKSEAGDIGAGPEARPAFGPPITQYSYNDIELEIEEPLMDALQPLAQIIYSVEKDKTEREEDLETL